VWFAQVEPQTTWANHLCGKDTRNYGTENEIQPWQQLFTTEQIGDRKPTQLLWQMEQLMGDHTITTDSALFLLELFLQKLPAQVRMVLASTDDPNGMVQLEHIS